MPQLIRDTLHGLWTSRQGISWLTYTSCYETHCSMELCALLRSRKVMIPVSVLLADQIYFVIIIKLSILVPSESYYWENLSIKICPWDLSLFSILVKSKVSELVEQSITSYIFILLSPHFVIGQGNICSEQN